MEDLLTKIEKRRLNIVKEIAKHHQLVSLVELEAIIGVSSSVLRSDIQALNKLMAEDPLRITNNMAYLIDQVNIDLKISQQIFRNNHAFKLLAFLFEAKTTTMDELMTNLHLSTASIYRLVARINDILEEKKCGFYVETSNFCLRGDENRIRFFLLEYAFIAYDYYYEWPFETIDQVKILECLENLINNYFPEVYIDYMILRNLTMFLAVNMIRTRNGYYVPSQSFQIETKILHILTRIKGVDKSISYLKEAVGCEWTSETIYQLMYQFFNEKYCISLYHLKHKCKKNEFVRYSVQLIEAIIDSLCEEHSVSIDNPKYRNTLVQVVHNSTVVFGEGQSTLESFTSPYQSYLINFEENYPAFYQDMTEKLQAYFKALGYQLDSLMLSLSYSFFIIHWPDIQVQLENNFEDTRILIINSMSRSHAEQIESVINNTFPPKVVAECYKGDFTDQTKLNQTNYDLIISDHPLFDVERIPVYVMGYSVMMPDLGELKNLITIINSRKAKKKHQS